MSDIPEMKQIGGVDSTNYQAGHDIQVNNTIINYGSKLDAMSHLVKIYNEEKGKGERSEFAGYIRKLEKFTTQKDGDLKTLEVKLAEGGFEDDYEWALELKEDYQMLLLENKFSEASQKIHATLLAWIMVFFKNMVLPKIREGCDKAIVKSLIIENVIVPIENICGGENNVLDIYADDINGMIYYLTGNCHLIWT